MTKSAIPNVSSGDAELKLFASSVKQNLDAITGQARSSSALRPLPADATLAQVISQLNLLLQRIQ
jgi:hypothetical protein